MQAARQLSRVSEIDTHQLDAKILLAHALHKEMSYLITWPEKNLTDKILAAANLLLQRRLVGEPIAYILGYREFWSLKFKVTPDVLIPRPETELLVQWCLDKSGDSKDCELIDLGTGSGAIAVAIASERPSFKITATDYSKDALNIARENAKSHNCLNIRFKQGYWFDCVEDEQFDIIVSNPPYVAVGDEHLTRGDLVHEPIAALAAEQKGLEDIQHIVNSARKHLKPGGYIAIEHGYDQAATISLLMSAAGFVELETISDLANIDRITTGRLEF